MSSVGKGLQSGKYFIKNKAALNLCPAWKVRIKQIHSRYQHAKFFISLDMVLKFSTGRSHLFVYENLRKHMSPDIDILFKKNICVSVFSFKQSDITNR